MATVMVLVSIKYGNDDVAVEDVEEQVHDCLQTSMIEGRLDTSSSPAIQVTILGPN